MRPLVCSVLCDVFVLSLSDQTAHLYILLPYILQKQKLQRKPGLRPNVKLKLSANERKQVTFTGVMVMLSRFHAMSLTYARIFLRYSEAKAALEAKLKMEREAAEAKARRILAAKREMEKKQRALLSARLEREEKIRAVIREKQQKIEAAKLAIKEARKQPKSVAEEKELAARYAALEDLGDRAFSILVDLGMVIVSPDPNASDYDSSQDDEFVQ